MRAPRFGMMRRGLIGLGAAAVLSLGFAGAASAQEPDALVVNPTPGYNTVTVTTASGAAAGAVLTAINPTGANDLVIVVFEPLGAAASVTPLVGTVTTPIEE